MIDVLAVLLRIAGGGLILLALVHLPVGRALQWREDCAKLSPVNAAIFHVHTLFIILVLVMIGLPCLLEPDVFLLRSRAGLWATWSLAVFWTARLYAQFFVYPASLWRGKRRETAIHWWVTFVWAALAALFAMCGALQLRAA